MFEENTVEVTPTPFNEKLIVQYLLGELPEKECVEIEDRAFEDEQYMQEILDVESDLIDEYVRGEVPVARRRVFEEHFLASSERRRKLEFARALAEAQKPAPIVIVDTEVRTNPIAAFFRSLTPVNGFAFATVLLLMFVGAAWLIRDSIKLRAELNQLRAERQTQEDERLKLEEQLASERRKIDDLLASAGKDQQQKQAEVPPEISQPKPVQPARSSVLALNLLPGLSRSNNTAPGILLTPGAKALALSVGIDVQDVFERYRVEVRSPTGQQVWSRSNVRARVSRSSRTISVSIPANVLRSGRYEVLVQGSEAGSNVDLGFYYFEVKK